ncbi:MAG: DUF1610 domain-containing protein [Methanomassiliicoccales archaeon]|nr:MAG: DUF1610 domain-containing protein [Methanomassiliicoccales archaeon]
MEEQRCSSCGAILFGEGNVLFKCPSCGESVIGRCAKCRNQSVPYSCKACGFEGP